MTAPTDVELRVSGGLAGTQTVEIAVTEDAADTFTSVLEKHDIGYEVLDKRLESLPGASVLSVGSFHLGADGAGLGRALQDFARACDPTPLHVTIGGTPYEPAETGAVASALVALRTAQEAEDSAADQARAQWQRGYEMEQGAEDSEEPK